MTVEQWNATDEYDLEPGELLSLNLKLYRDYSKESRRGLITAVNKKHCPKKGNMYETTKLTETRLAKIMSGSEYNSAIVQAIKDELSPKEPNHPKLPY